MTTTDLKLVIVDLKISETDAMNFLQNHGMVSDNCVNIADIAEPDIDRIAEVLALEFQ